MNVAEWSDEAECERVNGRHPFAAVIANRPRKPTSAAYVILGLETFARLLADADD